jgi:hypothetical protein
LFFPHSTIFANLPLLDSWWNLISRACRCVSGGLVANQKKYVFRSFGWYSNLGQYLLNHYDSAASRSLFNFFNLPAPLVSLNPVQ